MNDKIIYPEKKNQEKKSIIVIVSILLIILIIVIGFLISNSNKAIIKRSFSQIEKKTSYYENILTKNSIYNDKYKMEGTITPNVKIDSKDTLNTGFDIDKINNTTVNYVINKNNDDLSMDYEILLENESKGIIKSILKDSVAYLNINDSWAKLNEESTFNIDDFEYLKDTILKSLSKNIDSDLYSSKNETITIDGKKINAKKVSVTINDNNLYKIVNAVINDLEDDKKANNILKNNNIVINNLKLKKEDVKGYKITYDVYKKGTYGKYIAFNLSISDGNNETNITYKTDKNDDLKITLNGISINLNVQKQDDSFNAKLNVNEQEVATLECIIEELKQDISLGIHFSLYNIDLNVSNEYEKTKEDYNIKGETNLLIKFDNQSVLDASLKNKGTLTSKSDDIKAPKDAKESVDIISISEFLNPLTNEYLID